MRVSVYWSVAIAPTHILGISAFYHDSAACLVSDGRIVAAAQEERFTRTKHDPSFPIQAVRYCLAEAGIEPADLHYVAFYDKPWLKFERLLETSIVFAPAGLRPFLMSMPLWLKQKLWMHDLIGKQTGFDGEILYPEHHQSHAAAAFFPSPFERAAILTVDGVGEWATASWGVGRDGEIDMRCELRFPHSVGLLYSAFTYQAGFRVNSGEYKLMGLAPYGEPRYVDLIRRELVDVKDDGSIQLNMKYFDYCRGLKMTSAAFDESFGGPPRRPESEITRREMDLARSIQEVAEDIVLRMARHVRAETGERDLCLAGGVALNCVANGRLLREGVFDRLWIQPAAGDAGGAVGAALFAWHQVMGNDRTVDPPRDAQRGSLLGPAFSAERIAAWLDDQGYPYARLDPGEVPAHTAAHIADGRVVGRFDGRMEFGPRALGARSILADARDPTMQFVLNLKVKKRESFRPFAPACLAEDASQYFDLAVESPYMLLTAPVREERRLAMNDEEAGLFGIEKLAVARSDIPAVTHVDYSARVQTVDRERSPTFHRLIEEFRKLTGCGVVINTSFNVRGEPIVCTPRDAYSCFMHTDIDVLVLQDCVLLKEEQPPLPDGEEGGGTDLFALPAAASDPDVRRAELRRFGLIMAGGCAVIGGLGLWRARLFGPILLVVAGLFLVAALLAPRLLSPVERVWMGFARVMATVMTYILLAVTFFVVVTPLGVSLRLLGKDPMSRRWSRRRASLWTPVDRDGPASRPDTPY